MPHVLAQDLRNAVLQAAFQGKLTTRLETDSSVDSLIEYIENEKAILTKEKKMKKEKPLPPIEDDEIPFDIPEYWRFVRTGNVIDCSSGSTPLKGHPEYYKHGTIPWLKTGELNNSYITKCEEKITELAYKEGSFRMNQPGDILIAMYGATIGKLGICTFPVTTNQACLGCSPLGGINNLYLFYYFMSAKAALTDKAEGGAQPNISRIKVRNHPIPLAPIEEQARIVAKVDELMVKIDEYEKIEKELISLQKSFPGNMKDAILQSAMQGKLTEQLDEDEIFNCLSSYDVDSEDRFDIPSNWKWYNLKDLLSIKTGKKDQNYATENGNYNFYTCAKEVFRAPNYSFEGEALIMPGNGANVGEVTLYNGKFEAYQRTYVLQSLHNNINMKYMYYCLLENWNQYNKDKMFGSAIPYIKLGNLQNYPVPLPPIEEQQRIVEKLDQLLPLCERLEELV